MLCNTADEMSKKNLTIRKCVNTRVPKKWIRSISSNFAYFFCSNSSIHRNFLRTPPVALLSTPPIMVLDFAYHSQFHRSVRVVVVVVIRRCLLARFRHRHRANDLTYTRQKSLPIHPRGATTTFTTSGLADDRCRVASRRPPLPIRTRTIHFHTNIYSPREFRPK